MGVTLDRQVQRRVGRMQIPDAGRPVRQPLDRHRPEHRLQRTPMTGLDPTARHTLITDDLVQALLADRAQREMVIEQPAQQLPPVAVKMLLKLGVREPAASVPSKKHSSDSNCSRLAANPAGRPNRCASSCPQAHLWLHHRYQGARQAGLRRSSA